MTAAHQVLLGLVAPAYLLGSVPFGLLVARTRGIDPRRAGSGNIGATNVGRLLGGKYFAIVFIFDMLKGLLPMLAAAAILRQSRGSVRADHASEYLLWLLVGFAAILGHMFSIFLGFKGGKGVATSSGVVLGLFPYYTLPAIVAMAGFLLIFKTSRYVSLASICAAVIFALAFIGIGLATGWPVFGEQWPLTAFAILVAVMIVYKHRSNLARLRAGTESRFGRQEKSISPP